MPATAVTSEADAVVGISEHDVGSVDRLQGDVESPAATLPQVVATLVCGISITPKSRPETSFTVSEVPYSATEP